jgi:hypothetical protein
MCAWLNKKFKLRMELFFGPAESHLTAFLHLSLVTLSGCAWTCAVATLLPIILRLRPWNGSQLLIKGASLIKARH